MALAKRLKVVDDKFDVLRLDKDSYDPDEFYVASTDKRGHSDQINAKIPQGQLGHIWTVIHAYPEYRSVQDFLRDAVVHLLHKRNETLEDRGVDERIQLDMSMARMHTLMRDMESKRQAVEDSTRALKDASQNEDWEALARALMEAEASAQSINDPYRGKLVKEIEFYTRVLEQATKRG